MKPWRSGQFKGGYVAEYLPVGQATWRMLKKGGQAIIFPTTRAAISAAEDAFLRNLTPDIRSTLPVNPKRAEARLADEAEKWLRSRREDIKKQTTIRKPGRREVIVMTGRV